MRPVRNIDAHTGRSWRRGENTVDMWQRLLGAISDTQRQNIAADIAAQTAHPNEDPAPYAAELATDAEARLAAENLPELLDIIWTQANRAPQHRKPRILGRMRGLIDTNSHPQWTGELTAIHRYVSDNDYTPADFHQND